MKVWFLMGIGTCFENLHGWLGVHVYNIYLIVSCSDSTYLIVLLQYVQCFGLVVEPVDKVLIFQCVYAYLVVSCIDSARVVLHFCFAV